MAGLGNPGYEYALTPHNLGFMAVDRLAENCGVAISRPEAQALIARARIGGRDVVLAKPQTYMNLSGSAIANLLHRYGLAAEDLIVLVDEIALPLGTLRIRERGSAGGHNGLKSIIGALQSDAFVRIRMGVKPEHPLRDLTDYLLSPLRKADLARVADAIEQTAAAVEMIISNDIQTAMNRYNRRVQPEQL